MPVNYVDIRDQIIKMGQHTHQRQLDLLQKRQDAAEILAAYDRHTDLLQERIRLALAANPALRCAQPGETPLTALFSAPPGVEDYITLAADGSQINPNFHDPVAFSVINVGVFRLASAHLNQPPLERVKSSLLIDDDISGEAQISEDILALRRDLAERLFLTELASLETLPLISLTDGPLELFHDPKERPEYQVFIREYLEALQKLANLKTAAAGYVDRPRSDLIIRMLELTKLGENDLKQAGKNRPLRGVSDADLFRGMLSPGQRTAVFGIQSPSSAKYSADLALHFFYLNTGFPNEPSIARVEIPAWVASDPHLLSLLHAGLVDQCRMLGTHPYPYALHRAHEVAVVHFAEKDEISSMIISELNQQGLLIGPSSNKQLHKNESGIKKRFTL